MRAMKLVLIGLLMKKLSHEDVVGITVAEINRRVGYGRLKHRLIDVFEEQFGK